jgi:hypothetical protein
MKRSSERLPSAAMVSFARLALRLAVAGAFLFAPLGSAGAVVRAKPVPGRLIVVPGGVQGFAMDGDRFVYSGGRASTVELGSFANRGQVRLGPTPDTDLTHPIALAGTRAVWGAVSEAGNSGYGKVTTGAPGTKPFDLEDISQTYHAMGDYLTGTAGDGKTLVYAIVTVDVVRNFDGCFPESQPPPGPQTCDFKVTKWAVKRVVGRGAVTVPKAPPSVLIAVSGNRLALVPADRRTVTCSAEGDCPRATEPSPVKGGPVEIRDAKNGALVSKFSPKGSVKAIALSDRLTVVLVRGGSARIERYDARTGALRGRTVISPQAANELNVSGDTIVYHVKTKIHVLDARTGNDSVLAASKATPIGLSVEGRRVAWVENVRGQGRIASFVLVR